MGFRDRLISITYKLGMNEGKDEKISYYNHWSRTEYIFQHGSQVVLFIAGSLYC